jgi:hypothetical protein
MDDELSHYELLGLEREATAAHIRAAYLRLCTTTHPDRVRTVAPGIRNQRRRGAAGLGSRVDVCQRRRTLSGRGGGRA